MSRWTTRDGWGSCTRAVVAVLVTACLALSGGCAPTDPGPATPGQGTARSASPSQVATPTPASLDIYYLVGWGTDLRLAPEAHQVRTEDAPDARVFAAISEMLGTPASDPDYSSGWAGTRLLSVQVEADLLTIDVSEDARSASWTAQAAFAVAQQLIHTATAAAGSNVPVALLVGGEPAGLMWGEVDWSEPLWRAPASAILLLVRIDTPAEGDVVGRSLRVTGSAVPGSHVPWSVLTLEGTVVATGLATAADGEGLAPFDVTIQLPTSVPPGQYRLVVTQDPPSDPLAEPGPMRDDKQIVVR